MQMLPFLLEKEQMDSLVRERDGGITWFNRVYTDPKGPTGPISTVADVSRFTMAILNEGELDGRHHAVAPEQRDGQNQNDQSVPGVA